MEDALLGDRMQANNTEALEEVLRALNKRYSAFIRAYPASAETGIISLSLSFSRVFLLLRHRARTQNLISSQRRN
jgi:hypothetical protein